MEGSPSSPYPASTPAIAFLYLATIVTVEEDGVWKPAHEVARTRGTLHIITAWNPGDERPTRAENDRANAALHADLVMRGLTPFPALGSDPNSSHAEESWAVTGLDDATSRELGAKYGQIGVFRITHDRQTVLACFADWQVARGV